MASSHPSASGSSRRAGESYGQRASWFVLAALVAMSAVVLRLWIVQILDGGTYHQLSTENIVRDVEMAPSRGRIFDANGVTLADNRPSFDVIVTPRTLERHEPERTLDVLEELINLTPRERERMRKVMNRNIAETVLRRDITRSQVALLQARQQELPGVEVRPKSHRFYPFHSVGAHTMGFLGEIGERELAELGPLGYRAGDYIGRMGLERAFEDILHGSPGIERDVVDARGNPQGEAATQFLVGEYQHVSALPGRDVVTTLDTELMLIIDEAMRHKPAGSVVALDPRDGSVLALYSKPAFNPNSWTGRLSSQEKLRSDNDPYKPMLDKSVNAYFPGSVYKIVGAVAALEEGLLQREDELFCGGFYRFGGRNFRCWKRAGHKHTDVAEALAESCDVYFYRVAEELGIDKLSEYAYRFGFGEPSGLPINQESAGRVPTKEWHRKHGPDGYQYGFALNTVIGQGDTLTSPLQVALAYGALANGGDLYYPRLLKEVRARGGETLFEFPPRRRKRVDMAPEHLEVIRQGLARTVNHETGTAYSSRLEDVRIAGKTGTAQVHKIGRVRVANRDKEFRFRDHAWFASYAPAEDPEIVLVVFLQHGGHGGSDAAPVAQAIYDAYFHRDGSRPLTERVSELAARRSARERLERAQAEEDAEAGESAKRGAQEADDGAQ